jgi:hypothetical protein
MNQEAVRLLVYISISHVSFEEVFIMSQPFFGIYISEILNEQAI